MATETTIGRVLDESGGDIQTGPFGTKLKAAEYTADGVPVISVGEIGYGRLRIHTKTPRVNESITGRMPEYLLRSGDIVFARKGAVDRSALVLPEQDGWFLGSDGIRIRLPTTCNPTFVSYQLLEHRHREWILQHAAGTTMASLNEGIIREIPIHLPELGEQEAIAAVLGSLDDKIEQNRRTVGALERLARAIFKAWFVDFEPVKAKAAGAASFSSMAREVFNALPAAFEDSDIGPVPVGWEVKALAECVQLTMGQSPPSEFYNQSGDGLPFHQGVTDYGFRFPKHRVFCAVDARLAEAGDVLLSVRAPVGRINVADRRLVLGRGLAGLRHPEGHQSFLLYHLFHVFAEEDAIGDGTIYKAVTKRFLSQMQFLSPSPVLVDAYERIVNPMDELILAAEQESRKLAGLRELLLPRLLSGDVRVGVHDG